MFDFNWEAGNLKSDMVGGWRCSRERRIDQKKSVCVCVNDNGKDKGRG